MKIIKLNLVMAFDSEQVTQRLFQSLLQNRKINIPTLHQQNRIKKEQSQTSHIQN